MTLATAPSPTAQHPPNHSLLISLALLIASFLLTLYTHTTCLPSDSHTSCTTLNNLTLGLAVLLAYLAAVGFYTSHDGRIVFPVVAVCYSGVLGVLVLSGVHDLRTGLGYILGVELGIVGVFLGMKMLWCGRGVRYGGGDEEEVRLVGGMEGCVETRGDGIDGAVHEQVTRREEKGDGRVDVDDGDARVVAEEKTVPGS